MGGGRGDEDDDIDEDMIGVADPQKEDAAGDGTGTIVLNVLVLVPPTSLHSRPRRRMDGPVSELGPMKIHNFCSLLGRYCEKHLVAYGLL
mmetsp:Transcript_33987/g.68475  ORF Transcript_33987/g.68475 Transcript_33987/m.68475 type:complete len:90 (-) Transcript_33987:67-336(-)